MENELGEGAGEGLAMRNSVGREKKMGPRKGATGGEMMGNKELAGGIGNVRLGKT